MAKDRLRLYLKQFRSLLLHFKIIAILIITGHRSDQNLSECAYIFQVHQLQEHRFR